MPLEVFAVIPGGSTEEARIHAKFAAIRHHGEWFHATAEILRFAWVEQMASWWNRAPQDWRNEFLERTDTPVFDAPTPSNASAAA